MNTGKPARRGGFLDTYLAFLLARASHAISSGFHAELKRSGVSIGTWRILAVLRDEPRTVNELADRVLLNQPTMSKAIGRLEADGLLERGSDGTSRRHVLISITPAGRQLVDRLIPLANAHEEAAFAHLSAAQRRELVRMLRGTIERNRAAPE